MPLINSEHVRVGITRIDPSLPLPRYATRGAAAFDLSARVDVVIAPGELARIPTNVIVNIPDGHMLLVSLRSSTPGRLGLLSPHGPGIIDADYCGPEDEVHVLVYNFRQEHVTVRRGDRVAQAVVLPARQAELIEAATSGPTRGGFGSTG